MIRNWLIVLLLFVLYEGFYFLPEQLIVLPGVFRMSDAFFLVLPFFCLFFIRYLFRTFQRLTEESWLVMGICVLMLISPLMARIFFNQPYQQGLILIRQNFFWLSFFMFILLLRNLDGVDKSIRLLTLLVGIYVFILLMTKYDPSLGIIHYTENFYSKSKAMIRFGEHRLFFPYGTVPVLFYCITLARLLYPKKGETYRKNAFLVLFLLLVGYAILSTFTRALVFSLLAVTGYALFTSQRPYFRYLGIMLGSILVFLQLLSMAVSMDNDPLIGETKIGKMLFKSSTLESENGRKFQAAMYMTQFVRSPLTGVGNLATKKDTKNEIGVIATYRKYGFFNGSDLGFLKIAGESGLAGIAWVIWFYSYLYRRSKETLAKARLLGNAPMAEAIARGIRYFLVYLLVTGVTMAHFVLPHGIIIVAFSIALMAVTRESVDRMRSAKSLPALSETYG